MRILVDHGAYPNFGDLSMLDAAVDRLARIEGARLDINDAPLEWRWSGAVPVRYKVLAVDSIIDRVARAEVIKGRIPWGLSPISAGWRSMAFRLLSQGWTAAVTPARTADGWRTLGRWCRQYDALFIAGGGDMNDYFPEALWRCCALIHAFANQGKPVILSGQQLGPVHSPASRRLLLSALKRVTYIGVREPTDSLRFCVEAGLHQSQFAMCGDDSLGMVAAGTCEVNRLMQAYDISPRGFIAVNLRIARYNPVSAKALSTFAETLAELSAVLGVDLVVVPVSVDEGDSDVQAGLRLAERMRGVHVKVIRGERLSGQLIKGLLGHAIGAIGTSYHFNTFALTQDVPAIAVFSGDYYRQKAQGLAAFWGDERLAMPFSELDAQAALRIIAVFEDEGLRRRLRAKGEQATRDWEEIFAVNVVGRLKSSAARRR
jgi:polysaccharide pyruvyl transferase WcaK-like protein